MPIMSAPAGFDEFLVQVGSKSFDVSADWPGYIADQLRKGFDNAAGGVQRVAREHIANVVKYVEHFHGSRPWNGRLVNDSNRLQKRSGKTIDAFKKSAQVTASGAGLDKVEGKVNVGMFGIHLEGGTVTARRSRYLTIPLPSACDRRGVPLKRRARDWPNTFVLRSRRGNLLIVQKQPGGGIKPLYLLKSSVRIPARMSELPSVWDAYTNRFERAVIHEIERAIDALQW